MVIASDWPKDIVRQDIQAYLHSYFKSGKAPKHSSLEGQGNRCKNTGAGELLSLPQTVVHLVTQGMAQSPNSTNRGLLVWWSTGSGKACCAASVMDSYWDTDKTIVFATSVEAAKSNPPSTFHRCAQRFFPRFAGKTAETVAKDFAKRKVQFMTFAQLAHYLLIANALKRVKSQVDVEKHKNFLKNAVLIIDEVHNIFKPLPNQKQENDALKKLLLDIHNPVISGLNLVILTATPGDNQQDVVDLLNMVRDKATPPLLAPAMVNSDLESFKESVKGLISYFDMSKDYTKYPQVVKDRVYKLPMSHEQFKRYAIAFGEEPEHQKDFNALEKNNERGKYYRHSRRYSNMLYDIDPGMKLTEFSSKLPMLLENIVRHPADKHFIYSAFYEKRGFGGHGIVAVAKVLEEQLGYTRVYPKDIKKGNIEHMGTGKRYILALSGELEDREMLKHLVTAYNSPTNNHGQHIQLFLTSQAYNEGLDLHGVRHVHIFEPLLSVMADKQTIGRAARYCSHVDLERESGEWTVQVHRYVSTEPVDLSMYNMNYLRRRVAYLENKVSDLKKDVALGAYLPPLREKALQDIKLYEEHLIMMQKKVKEVEKTNIANVKMIDSHIQKQAIENSKKMLAILQSMKEAAIDYRVMAAYHGLG